MTTNDPHGTPLIRRAVESVCPWTRSEPEELLQDIDMVFWAHDVAWNRLGEGSETRGVIILVGPTFSHDTAVLFRHEGDFDEPIDL